MAGTLKQVIAQLLNVHERLAATAVSAMRAQVDAVSAEARYLAASHGSNHPQVEEAVTDIRTAGEKSAKVARLLEEAKQSLASYLQRIAPGSLPEDTDGLGLPPGDKLMEDTDDRGNKLDAFIRRHAKKLEDTEETLKKTEKATTAGVKKLFNAYKGSPGTSNTSATTQQPLPADRPQVEHPFTAVVISAGAAAIGLRKVWQWTKDHQKRSRHGNQA